MNIRILLAFSLIITANKTMAIEPESCEIWQQKANTFMTYRQQDLPIVEAMQEASGNKTRGLLLRAYQAPVENGLEAKYRVIGEFAQQVFEECNSGKS